MDFLIDEISMSAIDGQNIEIDAHQKQFPSIILMALLDAGYKYIFVNFGANK